MNSKRALWSAVTAAVVLSLALACGSGSESGGAPGAGPKAPRGPLPPPRTLADLQSVDDLARAFDASSGRLRLVLLLSPT